MEGANNEKGVGLGVAVITVLATLVIVSISGYYIGKEYFWDKYENPTRLELELYSLDQDLKAKPNDPDLLVEKGWVYYQRGELNKAQSYYSLALDVDPENVGALYNLGLVHFKEKRFKEAEEKFLQIEKRFPKHLNNLMILGELYIATKKADKAIEKLEYLITIKNSWTQAHYLLGQAYELKGLVAKAQNSYYEALKFDPQFKLAKNRLVELGGDLNADRNTNETKKKDKI